jgi:hypothetical protein
MLKTEEIPFRGVIARDVYFRAQRLNSNNAIWLIRLAAIAFMSIIAISAYSNGDYAFATTLAGLAAVYIPIILAVRTWRFGRIYDQSPYLHAQYHGKLTEANFHIEGPLGTSDIPWNKLVKVRANDDLLLLYIGPNIFHVLTRDFFASDVEWKEARALAMRQFPN